jgi:hypothetical protein
MADGNGFSPMGMSNTNLQVLKPSRKPPRAGDIFRMLLPDGSYRFGRVVRADARWTLASDAPPAILIYIYANGSSSGLIPSPSGMRADGLLVAPILTNRLPWVRGYFEAIANVPLEESDVLSAHCFSDASVTGLYFDEMSNPLPSGVEPIGVYGLQSFRTIDDEVSDAIGIPRATDA